VEQTNSLGMPLALVPPGEFDMGSTPEQIAWAVAEGKRCQRKALYFDRLLSEAPLHRVAITRPFYLATCPVTQAEYEKLMGANPSGYTAQQVEASVFKPPMAEVEVKFRADQRKKMVGIDTRRHPVDTVSWVEAMEFCRRLSEMPAERAARRVYRLPTEAEWEYACRAGTTTLWFSGDDDASALQYAWYNKNSGMMTHPVGQMKPNAWGLFDMYWKMYLTKLTYGNNNQNEG
jgi:formylglycine-generating enzyme required for sulfatase activity